MQLAYYSARAGDSDAAWPAIRSARSPWALTMRTCTTTPHSSRSSAAMRTRALDALSRAVELGYPPQLMRAAPDFASLRGDARFRKLIGPADKSPQA